HLLIAAAAASCGRVSVVVMAASHERISLAERVQWLREAHAATAHVTVTGIVDDVRMDLQDAAIWRAHVDLMREALAAIVAPSVTAVFSSEAYGAELAGHFGARSVTIDTARELAPISATRVRADVCAHWDFLSPPVKAGLARRVVVIGAESTGTTTLSRDIADALRCRGGAHGATRWVEEYGRRFTIDKLASERAAAQLAGRVPPSMHGMTWRSEEFTAIARTQNALAAREARIGGPLLVCDTDAFATGVWHERYLGTASSAVESLAEVDRGAVYLLTDHEGVPFEQDGIRDGEHIRAWMNARFLAQLEATGRPCVVMRGTRSERLRDALVAINRLLAESWRFVTPSERLTGGVGC
ncbi:MAG: transcriptional regulator, partial [Rhodoferax sp.]|nr:transcriptional regulator [Rhodoferax sp.]